VKKTVAAQNREIEEYNKIVRKWNAEYAKDKGEKEFFEHLIAQSRRQMGI
jgi:hypothetical protein